MGETVRPEDGVEPQAPSANNRCIWLGLAPAMVIPFIGSLVYFVWLAGTPAARAVYALIKVFTILWPIVAIVVLERRRPSLHVEGASSHFATLPLGWLSGVLAGGSIVFLYTTTSLGEYVFRFGPPIREKVVQMGIANHYLLFSLFLAVVHSLIEEYYWRWYVFGRLRVLVPLRWAYILAGFSFAAHHYVILACFGPLPLALILGTLVALAGVFWSWLFDRQGSLVGAWISHMLVDAAILWVGSRLVFG